MITIISSDNVITHQSKNLRGITAHSHRHGLWSLKCHQQTSEQAELCHDTNRPFLQLVQQRSLPTTLHLRRRPHMQRSRSPGVVTCGKYLVTHLRRHIP